MITIIIFVSVVNQICLSTPIRDEICLHIKTYSKIRRKLFYVAFCRGKILYLTLLKQKSWVESFWFLYYDVFNVSCRRLQLLNYKWQNSSIFKNWQHFGRLNFGWWLCSPFNFAICFKLIRRVWAFPLHPSLRLLHRQCVTPSAFCLRALYSNPLRIKFEFPLCDIVNIAS